MRYDDGELNLIKSIFSENTELILTIRKFLLQGELTPEEKSRLTVIMNEGVINLLRKGVLPFIDHTAPLFQLVDMFTNVNTKEQSLQTAVNEIRIKDKGRQYLEDMFSKLEGDTKKFKIDFEKLSDIKGKTDEQIFLDIGTRNFLVSHIQMTLQTFELLSGHKEETVAETIARLNKDSAK